MLIVACNPMLPTPNCTSSGNNTILRSSERWYGTISSTKKTKKKMAILTIVFEPFTSLFLLLSLSSNANPRSSCKSMYCLHSHYHPHSLTSHPPTPPLHQTRCYARFTSNRTSGETAQQVGSDKAGDDAAIVILVRSCRNLIKIDRLSYSGFLTRTIW